MLSLRSGESGPRGSVVATVDSTGTAPAQPGMTSDAEVLDAFLEEGVPVINLRAELADAGGCGLVQRDLQEVGLGYVKVGQQATTLSGGEAQRVKLAKELSRRATGNTIYIRTKKTPVMSRMAIMKRATTRTIPRSSAP